MPRIEKIEIDGVLYYLDGEEAAQRAEQAASGATSAAQQAEESAKNAFRSEQNAGTSEEKVDAAEERIIASETRVKASEENANESAKTAEESAKAAKTSEENTALREENVALSEAYAKTSELNAKTSEDNAKASENAAKASEDNAKDYADMTAIAARNAFLSEQNASQSLSAVQALQGTIEAEAVTAMSALEQKTAESLESIPDDYATLAADVAKTRANIIDPDDFEGTDWEKLRQAMLTIGEEGHGVILIKRMYTPNHNINIFHYAGANTVLTFMGVGNNCGFNLGAYSVSRKDDTKSWGSCHFVNLKFIATSNHFQCANLIRMSFENCVFEGGHSVVRVKRFMQTWLFHNCIIRKVITYVVLCDVADGCELLDVQFHQCTIEACGGVIYAKHILGCTISQCCIEGNYGMIVAVSAECRSLNIVNNYFESNNDGFYLPEGKTAGNGETFVFAPMTSYGCQINISGNRFVTTANTDEKSVELILLPKINPSSGSIVIENNHTSPGSTLVKTHPDMHDIYWNVYLRNNAMCKYSDNRLLIDHSKSSLSHVTRLQDGKDLNNITEAGVYWTPDASKIENAPILNGEFFMYHVRTLTSFAQLAITSNGLKSRLGKGAWQ